MRYLYGGMHGGICTCERVAPPDQQVICWSKANETFAQTRSVQTCQMYSEWLSRRLNRMPSTLRTMKAHNESAYVLTRQLLSMVWQMMQPAIYKKQTRWIVL